MNFRRISGLLGLSLLIFLTSFISSSTSNLETLRLEKGIEIHQNANSKFLTISDVHLNLNTSQVTYGCDTGTDLWARAKQKLDDLIVAEKPDFVLYLGDLPVHAYQNSYCVDGTNYIHKGIGTVLAGLREVAQKRKVPLLYLPGNNDGYGGDYTSFTDDVAGQAITPYTEDPAGTKEWPMINTGGQGDFIDGNRQFGFFSAYPMGKPKGKAKGLRVIMLNTVIFVASPPYGALDGVSQQDAGIKQLNWLKGQLSSAATNKEAVIIAMHIPPGYGGYSGSPYWNPNKLYIDSVTNVHSTFNDVFVGQVKKHQGNIVGILTSHTHTDGMKRIIDGNDVIELTVSTPGISVNHDNNPGMKVFQYDPSNFELMDFTTYYTTPQGQGWGNKQYTFSQNYGCSSGTTMLECIQNLTNNDAQGTQAQMVSLIKQILYVMSPKGGGYKNPFAVDIVVK